MECWVPLKIAIPDPKDLPIIQVSLKRHASYEFHIKVGKALASLRTMNINKMFVVPYSRPFEKDVDYELPLYCSVGSAGSELGREIYGELIYKRVD
nr:1394_t:CDS:2 [Entrophospora candida]